MTTAPPPHPTFPLRPAAPLIVPDANQLPLPGGFHLGQAPTDDTQADCALARILLAAHVIHPLPPHPGDTPGAYVWRAYAATHAALLLHPDARYVASTFTISGRQDHAGLFIRVYARTPRTVHLHHFKQACAAVHPALYGTLVTHLRGRLAGFVPLYTPLDAWLAQWWTMFGPCWEEDLYERYLEDHPDTDPTDAEVLAWHLAEGGSTPECLDTSFPDHDTHLDPAVLPLLQDPATDHLPGITEIRALLHLTRDLPDAFRGTRCWAEERSAIMHPGKVTLLAHAAHLAADPVLEAHRDYEDVFDPEVDEHVNEFFITDRASHLEFLAYLHALAGVQGALDTLWKAVETPRQAGEPLLAA